MNFINDINFVFAGLRGKANLFYQAANIFN